MWSWDFECFRKQEDIISLTLHKNGKACQKRVMCLFIAVPWVGLQCVILSISLEYSLTFS